MARFTYLNNDSALDTQSGETLWVMTMPVHYAHLRANQLIAEHKDLTLVFTPERYLDDLRDYDADGPEQQRRLVIQRRVLETGHAYLVVVAVQAAEDSLEYVDCIVDRTM